MVATAKQKLKRVSGLEATAEKGSKADPPIRRDVDWIGRRGQIEADLRFWKSTLSPRDGAAGGLVEADEETRDGNLG
jgi:hypothetical protein